MSPPRRSIAFLAAAVLLSGACASHSYAADLDAGEAKQAFNSYGCNACHATDEARIGPPYRAVAFRYAQSPAEAEAWLAAKIIFGGEVVR